MARGVLLSKKTKALIVLIGTLIVSIFSAKT